MKVQKHAISLACLAALGFAGSAHALAVADGIEIIGNVYPEYRVDSFTDASTATPSTMTANPGAAKVQTTQVHWTNSYIGVQGAKAFGDTKLGFVLQQTVDQDRTTTSTAAFGDARDSYLLINNKMLGELQMGQMDTIYKEFGDRVRLLGTSSGNFTSTSNVISQTTWRSGSTATSASSTGVQSFNTRINGQLRWVSPNWAGVEVGVSYRPDPNRTAAQNQSLTSIGARWSNATYYVAVTQETHNDYHGISGTNAAGIYSGTAVTSKDTATKLSLGYTAQWGRLGMDFSKLDYNEDATAAGKVTNYNNTNWQITGEYKVTPAITIGGNYGVSGAGSCTLTTGTCSTDGLGGTMVSLGGRYDFDKNYGVFALAGRSTNNSSGQLGGANVGGNATSVAAGIQVKW
jgi:predicted porin